MVFMWSLDIDMFIDGGNHVKSYSAEIYGDVEETLVSSFLGKK